MSSKKRFENLAGAKPSPDKKPSILDKLSFKRKLEIEGVAREKLPVENQPQKLTNSTSSNRTHHTQQPTHPRSNVPLPPINPSTKEAKAEVDSLLREIEIAEQQKQSREIQRSPNQVQQKLEKSKDIQLEEARQRADGALYKILIAIMGIPILAYIVIQAAKRIGTGQRNGIGSEIIWLIIALLLGGYGRRRWNRW